MLGRQIESELLGAGLNVVGSDRDVDITDAKAVENFAAGKKISWIVNCAVYTAVDKAETEATSAGKANVTGVETLGRHAAATGSRMIHFSTDYVFDGSLDCPYREDDATNPLGVYGRTKLDGEVGLRAHCPRHFIFRISWLYGVYGGKEP